MVSKIDRDTAQMALQAAKENGLDATLPEKPDFFTDRTPGAVYFTKVRKSRIALRVKLPFPVSEDLEHFLQAKLNKAVESALVPYFQAMGLI